MAVAVLPVVAGLTGDRFYDPGGDRASVIATSPMLLIGLFARDVWALDDRAPGAIARLRDLLDRRRAENTARSAADPAAAAEQDA